MSRSVKVSAHPTCSHLLLKAWNYAIGVATLVRPGVGGAGRRRALAAPSSRSPASAEGGWSTRHSGAHRGAPSPPPSPSSPSAFRGPLPPSLARFLSPPRLAASRLALERKILGEVGGREWGQWRGASDEGKSGGDFPPPRCRPLSIQRLSKQSAFLLHNYFSPAPVMSPTKAQFVNIMHIQQRHISLHIKILSDQTSVINL